MIWYSLNKIRIKVMNKCDCFLESTAFIAVILWDSWFIFCLQEFIYDFQYISWQVFHQILVKSTLRVWFTCWDISGKTITWYWNIIPRYSMHIYLTYWNRPELRLVANWWCSLIPADRVVQILAEVQDYTLLFIKVDQLIIAHMFQVQFLNLVLKFITMHHAQQYWIYHISGF